MAFALPNLPYNYDALEPYIDTKTMQLHHDQHHQAYVNKVNAALEKHPELQSKSIGNLIAGLNNLPQDIIMAVRNHGGGHFNHSMFWRIMTHHGGGEPTGAIANVINDNFGDLETFKQRFNDAGANQFGSGWLWLVRTAENKFELLVLSFPTPLR